MRESAGEDKAVAEAISMLAGGNMVFDPSLSHEGAQEPPTSFPDMDVLGDSGEADNTGGAFPQYEGEEEELEGEGEPEELLSSAVQQALAATRDIGQSGDPG